MSKKTDEGVGFIVNCIKWLIVMTIIIPTILIVLTAIARHYHGG